MSIHQQLAAVQLVIQTNYC